MKNLTAVELNNKIFKIDKNNEYEFIGSKPCIIDFYADWCTPCKTINIILSQLEREYSEIDFFKVDAENEYELTEIFGIKSLPTLVMVNVKNDVRIQTGFLPKPKIEQLILEMFKIKNLKESF